MAPRTGSCSRSRSRSRSRRQTAAPAGPLRLGFVGVGAIGSGTIEGLLRSLPGGGPPSDLPEGELAITVRDSRPEGRVTVAQTDQAVVDAAGVVFVGTGNFGPHALAPAAAVALLGGLRFRRGQLVVSCCQRLTRDQVAAAVAAGGLLPAASGDGEPDGGGVVKAMSNPSPRAGDATTVLHPPHPLAAMLYGRVGAVIGLEREADFAPCYAATALMGSLFAQLRAAAGWLEAQGVAPEAAARYAAATHACYAREALRGCTGGVTEVEVTERGTAALAQLVAGQTAGGLNQQVLAEMGRAGAYEQIPRSLDGILARIVGRRGGGPSPGGAGGSGAAGGAPAPS
ncbi:unnamed protein product [Prorocentrum cordatum]|uniref:Pyrroline-5-carboxylate reductase n=1 Tax=Prorocentrum cordatum TaxID=2364126 RepID=A0ABN9QM12_9DINO|nr:unnamed protein product [Polarella glacialis]